MLVQRTSKIFIIIIIIIITYFYNFSYSLLDSIEDEMKLSINFDVQHHQDSN